MLVNNGHSPQGNDWTTVTAEPANIGSSVSPAA
jgi:hypothetical protein